LAGGHLLFVGCIFQGDRWSTEPIFGGSGRRSGHDASHAKNIGHLVHCRSRGAIVHPRCGPGSKDLFGPVQGQHGYSLRLHGLETGINDRAFERALVLHGADYVSPAFSERQKRLGRSWGCPVLSKEGAVQAIDRMRQGVAALFIYYPDQGWLQGSPFLQCRDRQGFGWKDLAP
jgi:hypothetical protein